MSDISEINWELREWCKEAGLDPKKFDTHAAMIRALRNKYTGKKEEE